MLPGIRATHYQRINVFITTCGWQFCEGLTNADLIAAIKIGADASFANWLSSETDRVNACRRCGDRKSVLCFARSRQSGCHHFVAGIKQLDFHLSARIRQAEGC